jgi:predicted nuclease of predicted toxin-antitoxin system
MKILLDDRLPQELKQALPEHKIVTVQEQGWTGKPVEEVLQQVEPEFEVWMTIAQDFPALDDLSDMQIAIIVLVIPADRANDLQPVISQVREVLETIESGELICLSA